MTTSLAEAFATMVLAHRWKILMLCLSVIVLFGYGTRHLVFSGDSRSFFGNQVPEVQDLRELDRSFTGLQSVLLQIAPKSGSVFQPKILELIQNVTEDAWNVPFVLRVQSLANHSHSRSVDDDIFVDPLIPPNVPIDDKLADEIAEIALNSDELLHRLVAESGQAAAIFISVVTPDDTPDAADQIVRHVRQMRDLIETQNPEIDVSLSGGVFSSITFAEAASRDLFYLVPLAVAIASVLLIFGLGTFAGFVGSFITMTSATVIAVGFAGWTAIELSPGTAVSPLAIMVLVIASCVHIVLGWKKEKESGEDSDLALRRSLANNLAPVTIANLTTAIGFLCLQFSSSPPLQEMGVLIAFGVAFGWLLSISLLPALCSLLPDFKLPWAHLNQNALTGLAAFAITRRRALLVIFSFITIASAYGISQIGYEDNFVRYFDDSFEFRRDADAIEEKLTGLTAIQYSFDSGDGRGVFNPEFLKSVDRFVQWAEGQDKVVFVSSPTKLFKRLNMNMNGDRPEMYRVAESHDENAQFLMFYEMSLPIGEDLNSSMDVGRQKMLLSVVLKRATSADLRNLATASETWLKNNEPNIWTKASGFSLVFAYITKRNNETMLYGVILVLIFVSFVLIFALKSWQFGLISLVPNLAPAIFAFGAWGLTLTNVNLGSSIVTTMTFGIVVDDTVHYLVNYLRMRQKTKLTPEQCITGATINVGNALIITTTVIAAGFLVMAMSGFQINEHIGWLTAMVVTIALISDFLLLPALILTLDKKKAA